MKETPVELLLRVIHYYCFLENIEYEELDSKDWSRMERLYNNFLIGGEQRYGEKN